MSARRQLSLRPNVDFVVAVVPSLPSPLLVFLRQSTALLLLQNTSHSPLKLLALLLAF